jgi:predicted ATPase
MINKINIKNFKCFTDTEIKFKKITILCGSNSVGKSSVIQALLLCQLTKNKLKNYEEYFFTRSTRPKLKIPLNGDFCLSLGNTMEVLTRDALSNIITFMIYFEDLNESLDFHFKAEDNINSFYELELKHRIFNPQILESMNNLYYLNAERIGPRLSYDADQQDYPNSGFQGEYAIQIIAQNREDPIDKSRRFKDTEDLKFLSQVRFWMKYIIPDFYLDYVELMGKIKKAHASFSNSSPTNVGFGISYILPIIVNGLIANKNSLFIVENPEAHLHPKGQSNLGFFLGQLASAGIQVLVETHSEHIINGVRRAALNENNLQTKDVIINFFDRKDEKNKTLIKEIVLHDTGDLSLFPRDFFDQIQQDMAELYKLQRNKK